MIRAVTRTITGGLQDPLLLTQDPRRLLIPIAPTNLRQITPTNLRHQGLKPPMAAHIQEVAVIYPTPVP